MNSKLAIGGILAAVGVVAGLAIVTSGGSKPAAAAEPEVAAETPRAPEPVIAMNEPSTDAAPVDGVGQEPRGDRRGGRGEMGGPEDWERRRAEWEANMTPEQREQMRARWDAMQVEMVKRFDKDGDGVVSDAERRAAREEREKEQRERMDDMKKRAEEVWGGPMPLSDREMMMATGMLMEQSGINWREMWRGGDTDGDGEVSDAEGEVMRANFENQMLQLQEDLFVKYDADQDGQMSDAEREQAATQMRAEMEEWSTMRRVDSNRDGKIDDDEALGFTSRFDQGERGTDLNRDGVVDETDYDRFLDLIKKK